jgi:hypothetical protein
MSHRYPTVLAVAAAALTAAALWAAAPALSGGRYIPDPVEFEAAVPHLSPAQGPARTSRRAHLVSPVVRPGNRFNLAGLRWRGGDIDSLAFRVRRDGERWSRWVAIATDSDHAPDRGTRELRRSRRASDPLWAGEADQLQLRLSGAQHVRGLRLSFVNTAGTATALDRAKTRLRRLGATVVAALRGLAGARDAVADTSQPAIVPRAAWGADKCPPRAAPAFGQVQLAFIHHTVSTNEYGPEDSAAMVLGICRYHRNTNGWNDIGYNFLVDRYGTIFEGRSGGPAEAVVGAQAQGYNASSTGIASLGTFSSDGQTPAGLAALARLLSWKLAVHGVPPKGRVQVASGGGGTNRYPAGSLPSFERISGHRDGNATACPGDGLYAQLPALRDMVAPGPPRAPTSTVAARERRNITFGSKAGLRVALKSGATPLGGRTVNVQTLGGAGWRTNHTVRTDAAGNAATRMRLSTNRRVRALFGGEPGLLPSSSPALAIGVRPRVTAAVGTGGEQTFHAGSLVRVTGAVRPRKATAILTVKRRTSGGALVRLVRRTVKLRAGRLATRVRVRRPAAYRLRLSVRADARNLSARSPSVSFRVE